MMAGMTPVRITEAPAAAAARMACCALHHGGKIAATASAPERACNESAAITTELTSSRNPACNQADRTLAVDSGVDCIAGKIRG